MSLSNDRINLINFIPFNISNDMNKWIRDARIIIQMLKSLNELSPQELWNKFNLNGGDIQQFFRVYLETTVRCYEKVFLRDTYADGLAVEQQIYRLVYELVLKLFQIINCIGSKLPKNNPTFSNYIVHIFDMTMCVNISSLYFHSPSIHKALNQFTTIYRNYLKPLKDNYINAFYDLLFDEENTIHLNTTANINELIHTLICVCNVLPELLYKELVTETTIVKLVDMVSYYNEAAVCGQSNANNKNKNDDAEIKLMGMRLVHLIFLYISQMNDDETRTPGNASNNIKIIFDAIQHYPNIMLPLKNIYKIEQTINFKGILTPNDYNYVMACLINCSMNEEFILLDTDHQLIPNKNTPPVIEAEQTVELELEQLVELFPTLSKDILTKCYSKCNSDVSKAIDFIFLHGNDEAVLDTILNNNTLIYSPLSTTTTVTTTTTTTTTNTKNVNNHDESIKKLTLSLVRTQNEEEQQNSNKIQQLAERYSISPAMAATLLNLQIDQYEDDFDDDFENDDHFQYIKGLMKNSDRTKVSSGEVVDLKAPTTTTSSSYSSAPFNKNHKAPKNTNKIPAKYSTSPISNTCANVSTTTSMPTNHKGSSNHPTKKPNYKKTRYNPKNKDRKSAGNDT